ncbi:hypothetical protein, partial [Streptomyces rimosus]
MSSSFTCRSTPATSSFDSRPTGSASGRTMPAAPSAYRTAGEPAKGVDGQRAVPALLERHPAA